MKHITRAFVILLAAVVQPVWAQPPTPPGCEPVNSAEIWDNWSRQAHIAYLQGIIDGGGNVYLTMFNDVAVDRRDALREETALRYTPRVLADVMTQIFADPANIFVSLRAAAFLARDKLDGKEIEADLRRARRWDRNYYCPK